MEARRGRERIWLNGGGGAPVPSTIDSTWQGMHAVSFLRNSIGIWHAGMRRLQHARRRRWAGLEHRCCARLLRVSLDEGSHVLGGLGSKKASGIVDWYCKARRYACGNKEMGRSKKSIVACEDA